MIVKATFWKDISFTQFIVLQVVFRPEPSRYRNLRSACADFSKLLSSCMALVENLKHKTDIPLMVDMACNWQVYHMLSQDFQFVCFCYMYICYMVLAFWLSASTIDMYSGYIILIHWATIRRVCRVYWPSSTSSSSCLWNEVGFITGSI